MIACQNQYEGSDLNGVGGGRGNDAFHFRTIAGDELGLDIRCEESASITGYAIDANGLANRKTSETSRASCLRATRAFKNRPVVDLDGLAKDREGLCCRVDIGNRTGETMFDDHRISRSRHTIVIDLAGHDYAHIFFKFAFAIGDHAAVVACIGDVVIACHGRILAIKCDTVDFDAADFLHGADRRGSGAGRWRSTSAASATAAAGGEQHAKRE